MHQFGETERGLKPATTYSTATLCTLPDRRTITPPERFLHVLFGFAQGPIRVVAGVDCLLILRNGTVTLAANVENLGAIDIRPDFDPFRLQITVQRFLEHARRGLEIA